MATSGLSTPRRPSKLVLPVAEWLVKFENANQGSFTLRFLELSSGSVLGFCSTCQGVPDRTSYCGLRN